MGKFVTIDGFLRIRKVSDDEIFIWVNFLDTCLHFSIELIKSKSVFVNLRICKVSSRKTTPRNVFQIYNPHNGELRNCSY